MKLIAKSVAIAVLGFALIGCGSDDDNYTGTFIDGPVDGVTYTCGRKEGKTANGGKFTCEVGSGNVTFSLGKLKLLEVAEEKVKEVNKEVFVGDVLPAEDAKKVAMVILAVSKADPGTTDVIKLPDNVDDIINEVIEAKADDTVEVVDLASLDTTEVLEVIEEAHDVAPEVVAIVDEDDAEEHLEAVEEELESDTTGAE